MIDRRRKGARFELDVCRLLTRWVTGKYVRAARDMVFRRRTITVTPIEGHWNGAGDLVCRTGVAWPFCVECKFHNAWELDGLYSTDGKWIGWKWWAQTEQQADVARKFPMLIFSRNNYPIYCMLPLSVMDCLLFSVHVRRKPPITRLVAPHSGVFVTRLDDLIAHAPRVSVGVLHKALIGK